MPFNNISKLTSNTPITSTFYFIDANVWIYALQDDDWMENWQQVYSEFFYDILDSTLDPPPKILMPSVLISEILNTYLRSIAMREYKKEQDISDREPFTFKQHYRPTQHYRDNYDQLCDDIKAFRKGLHFISDELIVSENPAFLASSEESLDFNDNFFYLLCKEFQKANPVVIVTNDGDFEIKDIPILTRNHNLLKLKNRL